MSRLLPIVLGLVLVVFALVDCFQSPPHQVRALPKPAWIAVIVLLPVLGAVAWLLAGRPRARAAGVAAGPSRPVAPDDNPDFLRQLRSIDEEHERMLRQWERDLRRRERGTRGGGAPTTGRASSPPPDAGRSGPPPAGTAPAEAADQGPTADAPPGRDGDEHGKGDPPGTDEVRGEGDRRPSDDDPRTEDGRGPSSAA